ncbi:MAG: tripartite tricarboxylate transporter TctB family protein [Deltaproteobacteria bacterium]|nr:tripartite tricarboxylate transporter TctB family protein [Deltaproteobacteria bacterium]
MKTQRKADIVVGCGIALFGIFIIYASTLITGGAAHRLPPETFPMVVGILMLLCGAGLALKSWNIRGADLTIHWPDKEGVRTIMVVLASIACYIVLLNPLGLPLASFLYIAFSIWYLKRSKWLLAIVISLVTAAISYFLFIRLLALSFPAGPFLD